MRAIIVVFAGVLAVLELTQLEAGIEQHTRLFVQVYVPWCGHCRMLEDEFTLAAQTLEEHNPPVVFAKLNAEQHPAAVNVTGYPALLYYEDGKVQRYSGPKTARDITQWLLHKVDPPVSTLATDEVLSDFLRTHPTALVLFDTTNSTTYTEFQKAASSSDEHIFAVATSLDSLSTHSVNASTLVLFKPCDDRKVAFTGEITSVSIQAFLTKERIPWISPLNDTSFQSIFTSHQPAVCVFYPYYRNIYFQAVMTDIIPSIKDSIRFVYMDLETADGYKLADFLGIDVYSQPTSVILDWEKDRLVKYVFTEPALNKETLISFIEAWKSEDLVPFFKSEQAGLPSPSPAFRRLAGSDFRHFVESDLEPTFVFFYVPYSSKCMQALGELEPVAKEYASKASFAVMDMLLNELEEEQMQTLPVLRLYSAGQVQTFQGEWTERQLRAFVAS